MSGYTPKKIIRGRLGTKTNQTGLKMSGCPSLLGKKPSINRYIRKRVNCLNGVCGVPLHQGRIWKVNRRNLPPYCKEASTRCLAGAGGIGNINTPYYRTPAPGEKGCILPSGKGGLLVGIVYYITVGRAVGTAQTTTNGYSNFFGYIRNAQAAQTIDDAGCPCVASSVAPLGDGSGGPPELLAIVAGVPLAPDEAYSPSPMGELITVFNSATAVDQLQAIIVGGQVFSASGPGAFEPASTMKVWRFQDGLGGPILNTNPFDVPAGTQVPIEIIYN